jgi:hypothetical protein
MSHELFKTYHGLSKLEATEKTAASVRKWSKLKG